MAVGLEARLLVGAITEWANARKAATAKGDYRPVDRNRGAVRTFEVDGTTNQQRSVGIDSDLRVLSHPVRIPPCRNGQTAEGFR